MLVRLPNRAYLQDLERFTRLITDDGNPDLTFELQDGLFSVHPIVMCMIAALSDKPADTGNDIHVVNISENSSTRYLQRMKLFDLMRFEGTTLVEVTEHEPAGRFIPLTRVSDNSALNAFVTDLVPLLHASPDEAASVKYVLFELIRNVLEHSGSKQGAYAAAQTTKSGRLLIGVADSGIGVRRSISRSHVVTTDRQAIELAFRPGLTGTTSNFGGNETNGGAGLFFMKSMATLARHNMVMVSGNQLMKLRKQPIGKKAVIKGDLADDIVTWRDLEVPFEGTAVGIDITVDETIAFTELLREIREVYHMNVRKSKKEKRKARFR